jgi:hypothetical protein
MIMIALRLAARSSTWRSASFPKLDELPHRLLLELKPQVFQINGDPVKRRIAE